MGQSSGGSSSSSAGSVSTPVPQFAVAPTQSASQASSSSSVLDEIRAQQYSAVIQRTAEPKAFDASSSARYALLETSTDPIGLTRGSAGPLQG